MAGPIQNEINQLLGTSAIIAGGKKKLDMDKAQLRKEAIEDDPKLAEQQHALEKEIKDFNKDTEIIKAGGIPLGNGAYQADLFNQNATNVDLQARDLALKTMQGKLTAIGLQRKEYAKVMGGKK